MTCRLAKKAVAKIGCEFPSSVCCTAPCCWVPSCDWALFKSRRSQFAVRRECNGLDLVPKSLGRLLHSSCCVVARFQSLTGAVVRTGPAGRKLNISQWTSQVCCKTPEATSQSMTVPSIVANATSLQSGEISTARTGNQYPFRVCCTAFADESQTLRVLWSNQNATSLLACCPAKAQRP